MKRTRTNRRPILITVVVVSAVALLVGVGALTFFGDNIRALLGASAESLGGQGGASEAAPYASSHRRLRDYGSGTKAEALSGNEGARPRTQRSGATRQLLHFQNEVPSSTEGYTDYGVNGFVDASEDALSTFAVDVDTGSYTLLRKKLMSGVLPPPEAVRVEELLNYFRYGYEPPRTGPFAVHMDAAPSPFTKGRHLMRVALQGRRIPDGARKPAHLVFLVDVSGSMSAPDKLPLAQKALRLLVDRLGEDDTVALVTYASGTRVILEPTGMNDKGVIYDAIASLTAGGSTAMSNGLKLAYDLALRQVKPGSVARVMVLSDGDANVGSRNHDEMLALIRGAVEEGVTLSTVGFGTGNYQDTTMEQLANKGNGNYFYCDSLMEARRVFSEQLGGTLEVIAKDVKLQVEFDPSVVRRYRLVGYENRDVADRDFRNDRVDAGEIGSGHSVTAVYELELVDAEPEGPLAVVRVRAKEPRAEKATEYVYRFPSANLHASLEAAPRDLRFVAGVVGAAERLRGSAFATGWDLGTIKSLTCEHTDAADRLEFCDLLGRAEGALQSL